MHAYMFCSHSEHVYLQIFEITKNQGDFKEINVNLISQLHFITKAMPINKIYSKNIVTLFINADIWPGDKIKWCASAF